MEFINVVNSIVLIIPLPCITGKLYNKTINIINTTNSIARIVLYGSMSFIHFIYYSIYFVSLISLKNTNIFIPIITYGNCFSV